MLKSQKTEKPKAPYLTTQHRLVDVLDEFGEVWPPHGVLVPAVPHDPVDLRWALLRALHAVPLPEELEEPLDGHRGVGVGPQGHDLPQEDPVGPHVRLRGVAPLEKGKDYTFTL